MTKLERLLKELKKLQAGDITFRKEGICYNVSSSGVSCLQKAWVQWPKYSGTQWFPVPSPSAVFPVVSSYYTYTKWDKDTEYGKLRYELVDFLIEFFEDCETYVVTSTGATPHNEFDFDAHKGDEHIFVIVKESLVPPEGVDDALIKIWNHDLNDTDVPFVIQTYR